MNTIDYEELPAPFSEMLAINQQPKMASCIEARTVVKWRQAKEEEDFKSAIQEAFKKEWQTQVQHELQEVEWYLHQYLFPQFTSYLSDTEKEAIVQDIVMYLRTHQAVPDMQPNVTSSNLIF